jgi:hypothetical protein
LATIGIFVVMFWAVLEHARTVLLPVASALVVERLLAPVIVLAERCRIPSWPSAALCWPVAVPLLIVALVVAHRFFSKTEASLPG